MLLELISSIVTWWWIIYTFIFNSTLQNDQSLPFKVKCLLWFSAIQIKLNWSEIKFMTVKEQK